MLPGAADRVLAMAEREQTHRHERETRDQRHSLISRVGVLGLGFAMLAVAFYMVTVGQNLYGLVALVGAMGTFASIYLWGTPRGGGGADGHNGEDGA